MTAVLVRNAAPGEKPPSRFADLTSAPLVDVRWQPPMLVLTFDGDLTAQQVMAVQLRAKSIDPNEEAILTAAVGALQANRDYLLLAAPDAATVRAQVARLTKIQNGLIRGLVGLFDGTD